MDRNSILKEAIRIEIELSQLKEPNSPSKTQQGNRKIKN